MSEIPGSPLSAYDLTCIHTEMKRALMATNFETEEIHLSDRRLLHDGVRYQGRILRRRADLDLDECVLIAEGRFPIKFSLEPDA